MLQQRLKAALGRQKAMLPWETAKRVHTRIHLYANHSNSQA